MTLQDIAAIASIVASVAVVATLMMIALQLRQNLQVTRMNAAQTAAILLSQNYGRVIEHGDLAEILVRNANGEELEPADRLRMSNFISATFRYFETLHTQSRYNVFERELWEGSERRMRQLLSQERVRDWWADSRRFYATSFAELADDICAQEVKREADPANP